MMKVSILANLILLSDNALDRIYALNIAYYLVGLLSATLEELQVFGDDIKTLRD